MKVIHVVPKKTIGGVEVAACSLADSPPENFDVKVKFVSEGDNSLLNPFLHLKTILYLWGENPDVVVSSLWWTSFSTIPYRIIKKHKLILFLHSQKRAHLVDFFFTFLQGKFADCFFADSEATIKGNSRLINKKRVEKISFLTRRFFVNNPRVASGDHPVFVYWGRLSKIKKIDTAIDLFSVILSRFKNSKFYIYGPDFGEKNRLLNIVGRRGMAGNVFFYDAVDHEYISEVAHQADFYLQLSEHEGMAMSVIEAMQLGLVPVVTPVGEIPEYCQHLKNSIIYRSHHQAVADICNVWNDAIKFAEVSDNATKEWLGAPLYRESFVDAVKSCVMR